MLPVQRRLRLGPDVERAVPDPDGEPSPLGGPVLGDIDTGPDLSHVYQAGILGPVDPEMPQVAQVPIDTDPEPRLVAVDLVVDVAGAGRHRLEQDGVEEPDRFLVHRIDRIGDPHQGWRGGRRLRAGLPQPDRNPEPLQVGRSDQPEVETLGIEGRGKLGHLEARVDRGHHDAVALAADRDDLLNVAKALGDPGRQGAVGDREELLGAGQRHPMLTGQASVDVLFAHGVPGAQHLAEAHVRGGRLLQRHLERLLADDTGLAQQLAQPLGLRLTRRSPEWMPNGRGRG